MADRGLYLSPTSPCVKCARPTEHSYTYYSGYTWDGLEEHSAFFCSRCSSRSRALSAVATVLTSSLAVGMYLVAQPENDTHALVQACAIVVLALASTFLVVRYLAGWWKDNPKSAKEGSSELVRHLKKAEPDAKLYSEKHVKTYNRRLVRKGKTPVPVGGPGRITLPFGD
ncbi:MAG: hypothetical protein FWG16_06770 [Micrococcales bacterium]|nr:hypothetical protein [Micrococcales bacterium]